MFDHVDAVRVHDFEQYKSRAWCRAWWKPSDKLVWLRRCRCPTPPNAQVGSVPQISSNSTLTPPSLTLTPSRLDIGRTVKVQIMISAIGRGC